MHAAALNCHRQKLPMTIFITASLPVLISKAEYLFSIPNMYWNKALLFLAEGGFDSRSIYTGKNAPPLAL